MNLLKIGKLNLLRFLSNIFCLVFALLLINTIAFADVQFTKEVTHPTRQDQNSEVLGIDATEQMIAIGLYNKKILFFSVQGEYLYSFQLDIDGSYTFFLDQSSNEINILLARGAMQYTLDSECQIVNAAAYSPRYLNTVEKSSKENKTVLDGQVTVILEKGEQVYIVDDSNIKKVLYEVNADASMFKDLMLIFVLPLGLISFSVLLYKQTKDRRSRGLPL